MYPRRPWWQKVLLPFFGVFHLLLHYWWVVSIAICLGMFAFWRLLT